MLVAWSFLCVFIYIKWKMKEIILRFYFERGVCMILGLGTHIKEIREGKNISLEYLEKLSGVRKSFISQIENNKSSPPREILKRIIRPLNISYVDLLIRAGTLAEEDLDEHNQFQSGTIELVVQEIVEIHYYDGSIDKEYWDEKKFNSIRSAKYYLRKNGFEPRKDGYSKTRYFRGGCERYLFAHIFRIIKPI